ncbi:MAG: alpha/beta hydrolase-fold protein [Bryobacteraceae bacterium]
MSRSSISIRIHARFASRYLQSRRDLAVYLPRGYESSRERYPVLYLQDGQNLFDPATAFAGQDWHAGVTADWLIAGGAIRPLIIVGIYNAGVRRISEYTPTRDRRLRKGGKAERYAQMLVREIKPFIDREYRTQKAAKDTAVGGSSLGALASLVCALDYPRVFGHVAALSPSVWWDDRAIVRMVDEYRVRVHPRIWLDTGTNEGDSPQQIVEDARLLRDALIRRKWIEGDDLHYCEFNGAGHNEAAWADRFDAVLRWIFPALPH